MSTDAPESMGFNHVPRINFHVSLELDIQGV